jgi:ABC-type lipoprotein export system ATPase subunit
VGPSGCGKSTLLEALGLILKPERVAQFQLLTTDLVGDLALRAGRRETQWARLRQHHLGYVPQTGGLLPFLTVKQNIALPASMSGRITQSSLLDRLIERLKLTTLLDRYPRELSIGERQRVSFARAIGEYGSVVFISGNLQGKTEIAPYLIWLRLEDYDYNGAMALAVILLVVSFVLLAVINTLERWAGRFQD